MGVGTEDAIGLEPACRGGTAGFGTSPGYLAAPGHHLRPVNHHARRVAQIVWLAGRRGTGGRGVQINARKRIIAFNAWAISACKCDCVLRVRSKTFRMYYSRDFN